MTNTQQPTLPRPRTPGPEMAALDRFYTNVTWTGAIEPNGMGPGSPAMTARGRGVHSRLHDGLWIVGDYRQDQFLTDGTFVLTWRLHWVTGRDTDAGQYRATLNDNYGHADVMRGRIDGDRLIYETPDERPVRLRLTWDLTDPAAPVWTNEVCLGGDLWQLVESYRMRPAPTTRPQVAEPLKEVRPCPARRLRPSGATQTLHRRCAAGSSVASPWPGTR